MKKSLLLSLTLPLLIATLAFSAKANFFPDVHVADWFYPYVEEIRQWGVVSGNADGTFAPERNINRAEFSKMLSLYDKRVDKKIADSAQTSATQNKTLPSVMYLEKQSEAPAECPSGWTQADFGISWEDDGQKAYTRICYTPNQDCRVMYLELFSSKEPAKCPDQWTQADYGVSGKGGGYRTLERVCYICS